MEQKEIKRVFSRIGLGMTLFLIIQQGIAGLLIVFSTFYAPYLTQNGWFIWISTYVPLYLIAFPVLLLIFRKIPDHIPSSGEYPDKKIITTKNMILLACISLGIVYPLNAASTLLAMLIGFIKGSDVINPLMDMVHNSSPWASFLFVVIVAPIMEEIIFRKFLYNKLIRFGGKVYIFFSAFVFALFHGNIYQLLYAFVLGIVFASIMYRTRNIFYCITLHFIINLFGSGISAFLLKYAGEIVTGIYGIFMLAIAGTGIVLGIKRLLKDRSFMVFSPPEDEVGSKKIVLLNVGMIVYMVVILGLIVVTLLV